MVHCSHCFTLNFPHETHCRRCGNGLGPDPGGLDGKATGGLNAGEAVLLGTKGNGRLSQVDSRGVISRSLVFLVLAAILLLIPLFFSLEWNGAEAQQTRVVDQKASLPFDVRKSEVVKAAGELQSQLVFLDDFIISSI